MKNKEPKRKDLSFSQKLVKPFYSTNMRISELTNTVQTPMTTPELIPISTTNKLFFGIGTHRIFQRNQDERERNQEMAQTFAKMRARQALEKQRMSELNQVREIEEYRLKEAKKWSDAETLRNQNIRAATLMNDSALKEQKQR